MKLGYIGLGKMGKNMVFHLLEKKYEIVAWNRSEAPLKAVVAKGALGALTLKALVGELPKPRVIWIMLPHTVVGSMLKKLLPLLSKGDVIIEGGNSHYVDTLKHAKLCAKYGVIMLDAGVSGGPKGARNGACVMVGGSKQHFKKNEKLFKDIALPGGYAYFGKSGAGHFVKMVHNGIEYGMMQALAEGFAVMKKSNYKLDLQEVARLYDHGSVIESRLVKWLEQGYREHGPALKGVSGKVAASGEGLWTVQAGKKLKVPTENIKQALDFRTKSQSKPSYTGQVLTTLRSQFGGHSKKGDK